MIQDSNETYMICPIHHLQYEQINPGKQFVCQQCKYQNQRFIPKQKVEKQNIKVISQNESKRNSNILNLNKMVDSLLFLQETFEKGIVLIKSMIAQTKQLIEIIENEVQQLKKQQVNIKQLYEKLNETHYNFKTDFLQKLQLTYDGEISQLLQLINVLNLTNQDVLGKEIQVTKLNKQTDSQIFLQKVQSEATKNQIIPNQNGQINAILYKNEIFYIKQFMSNNQVLGKLFRTNFDINSNPRFLIQEGRFELEISQGRINYFLNDDEGIEYEGKSKGIKYKGKFINGRYSSTPATFKNRKIIISEIRTGKLINSSYNKDNIKNQKLDQDQEWIKYNQRITQRDLQILDIKQQKWVTSNILDSFCCYLNQQSETRYFYMNQQDRQKINRILLVPSSLIQSFGNFTQTQQLLKQEFLEFEDLNFRLDIIYSQVGFIINQNQTHWQFIYFDFQKQIIYEFDSLGGRVASMITKALLDFFKQYLPQKLKLQQYNYKEQNDSYSCGFHVANFMNFMYEKQFDNGFQLQYSEREIKTKLLNFIRQ